MMNVGSRAPESLNDALDSLALSSHPCMAPGKRQLLFVGVPFGTPVTKEEAWELIRLIRAGYPATEHTLDLARIEASW